ncbi:MAG: acyl-CoA dehydrogenase family protein [Pseudomonadales bacterium]|nr:acyl-CoA dehydrogenase family protein [Pseudomonadales bacterium]
MFLESLYTEEQNIIAAQVLQLSRQYDDQYFLGVTKNNEFPQAFWQEISKSGYLGIITDPKFAGAGMSTSDLVVFLFSMAREGLASFQLINQILCSDIVSSLGTQAQCESLLPHIIQGDFWCYADMEHAQGRSLFDIATKARVEDDHYILDGNKCYAVRAQGASHLIVAARTEAWDEKHPQQGLSLFIVDASSAGIDYSAAHINIRVTDKREEVCATGDSFDSIEFNGVRVPLSGLLGKQGNAGEYLKRIACRQLFMLGLMNAGWGERLINKTVAYANERVVFKDALSSYQAVQHPMVVAKTEIEMAKLLLERAAEVFDEAEDLETLLSFCSVAKGRASQAAYSACDIAMQTHGGSGYDRDTGIISLWPLILMSRLLPLNNQTILSRFSELVLGLPGETGLVNAAQEIQFEARSSREIKLIELLQNVLSSSAREGKSSNMMALMGDIMGGELADYQDMIWSDGQSALPVKLEVFRQYSVFSAGDSTTGEGMAKSMVRRSPAKFGLSAMAMAAVSAGKGGKEKVMTEYLPKMMEGKLFCYCITEPGAGTNTHNVSTIAVDEGDHYRLNGQKTFISAADSAYFMAVVARLEVNGKKDVVGTFVMEASSKGISMTELDIAALGDPQFTVHFDDVILPKDALVGSKSPKTDKKKSDDKKGISEGVFYTLNLERIMVALGAMMIGKESLERAVKKAKEVPMFGPLPGASEDIKQKLANLKLDMELCNLALKKAAVAFDNKAPGKQVGMYANMAKYLSSIFAHDGADLALQIYGVSGLNKDLDDIGGLYQLGRVLRTVPINNEMVLNFLGENLMGLPKSYRV